MAAARVGHGVGKGVHAADGGVGHVGQATVAVVDDDALARLAEGRKGQDVSVDVRVVGGETTVGHD